MQQNHIYLVYKTTNRINNHFYVGVHKNKGITFDGYLGSGTGLKRAILKYGKDNFYRETLFQFDTAEEAYRKEHKIIGTSYLTEECYNMRPGGQGIRNTRIDIRSPEWRKAVSRAAKRQVHSIKRRRESSIRMSGEKNIACRTDVRKKISLAKKGIKRWYDQNGAISFAFESPGLLWNPCQGLKWFHTIERDTRLCLRRPGLNWLLGKGL